MAGTMAAMPIRYPAPLRPGDRIGVTSPSSGVSDALWGRFAYAVQCLRDRGFDVVVGELNHAPTHVSGPREARAAELMSMLLDPSIRAVVPPWGGETGIDLLDLLDLDAVAAAEPTWCVGFSDTSTWLTPLTLTTGIATIHGQNLMDTPYAVPDGILHWVDVAGAAAGDELRQHSPGRHRTGGWDDYAGNPTVSEMTLEGRGTWTRIDPGHEDEPVTLLRAGSSRGCVETVSFLAGGRFADIGCLRARTTRPRASSCSSTSPSGTPTTSAGPCTRCACVAGSTPRRASSSHAPMRPSRTASRSTRPSSTRSGCSACRSSPTSSAGTSQPFLALVQGATTSVVHDGGPTRSRSASPETADGSAQPTTSSTKHQRHDSPGSMERITGCCVSWKCAVACFFSEESQQPTCPHWRHRRRCTHVVPSRRHSSHPSGVRGSTHESVTCEVLAGSLDRVHGQHLALCQAALLVVDPVEHGLLEVERS